MRERLPCRHHPALPVVLRQTNTYPRESPFPHALLRHKRKRCCPKGRNREKKKKKKVKEVRRWDAPSSLPSRPGCGEPLGQQLSRTAPHSTTQHRAAPRRPLAASPRRGRRGAADISSRARRSPTGPVRGGPGGSGPGYGEKTSGGSPRRCPRPRRWRRPRRRQRAGGSTAAAEGAWDGRGLPGAVAPGVRAWSRARPWAGRPPRAGIAAVRRPRRSM